MPDTPPDAELVAMFLGGNERSFEDIYRRYAPLVFAVAMRSLGDASQAEEVVSGVFGHASLRLGGLREPTKLRAWLLAVTASEVSHLLRSVIRERRRRDRVATLRVLDAVNPNDDEAEYAKGVFDLARRSLSEDDQVLLGFVLAEVTGPELADALGVDAGAANTRKSRLYDRLRSTIEVYWVSRPRPDRCADLEALLARRTDVGLTRTTCRAIERHCRECPTCEEERQRVDPLGLLALAPLPVFTPHLDLRLVDWQAANTDAIRSWRPDGFPRRPHVLRTARTGLAAAGVVAIAIAGSLLGLHLVSHRTDHSRSASQNLSFAPSTTVPAIATSTTAVTVPPAPATTAAVTPSTTLPVTSPPTTRAPADAPAVKHATTTTTSVALQKHKKATPAVTTTTTTTTAPPTTVAPPILVVDSASVNLGTTEVSAMVSFHVVGAAIGWTATPSVSWLSVQPGTGMLGANAAGSFTLSMDRSSAPAGTLQATVEITTEAGTGTVSVAAVQLAAPTVSMLLASPSSITCNETTTVSASVSAPAGVRSVTLAYSGSGSTNGNEPMMASGSVYSASLATSSCREGSITWSVTATDDDGRSTTSTGPPIGVYA